MGVRWGRERGVRGCERGEGDEGEVLVVERGEMEGQWKGVGRDKQRKREKNEEG